MGFEQLQDNIPGQLGPFPGHYPSNKLRGCFWTGVLNLFFFPIMLNGISCISTCVHCLLYFSWAPLTLSSSCVDKTPHSQSPLSEAQAVTTHSVSLVAQSLNSLNSLVGSPCHSCVVFHGGEHRPGHSARCHLSPEESQLAGDAPPHTSQGCCWLMPGLSYAFHLGRMAVAGQPSLWAGRMLKRSNTCAFSLGRTSNWTKAGAFGGNSRNSCVCELYFDRIHDIYWARVRVVAGGEQSEWAISSELQLYRDSKDWGASPVGLFLGGRWGEGTLERSDGIQWESILGYWREKSQEP